MTGTPTARILVVIAGPQASGKSAIASALADAVRRDGESVALVELDQIAAMALPSLPDWRVAHAITATVTGMWARAEITCVIAEGVGTQEEALALVAQAPPGTATLTVVTTCPFEVAWGRADADPTRGISRDRDFLSAVYERWTTEMPRIDRDLLIDTSLEPVEMSVHRVREAIGRATASTG